MTTLGKAAGKSERLAVLNNTEQEARYGLPDFDDAQRLEILVLDESELALASGRQGLPTQMYCILQSAYFKARHLFFRFGWSDVKDDSDFILSRYFMVSYSRTNLPLSTNAMLSGKKSAHCIGHGHLRCLHNLSNRAPTLFTAM